MKTLSKWILGSAALVIGAGGVGCKHTCCTNLRTGMPVILCQPEDHSVTVEEPGAVLEVEATGQELEFQWFKLLPTTKTNPPVERLMDGATNSVLKFAKVEEANYGLYFCEIHSHPEFGTIQETRSRQVSLSGPAAFKPHVFTTPPQKGNVRGGSAGLKPCNVVHSNYVKFPDSGPGFAPDTNTTNCITWLSISTNKFKTEQYKLSWLSKTPFKVDCAKASNTNTYYFASSPRNGNTYMFTAYFLDTNAPPVGSQVTLNILWE